MTVRFLRPGRARASTALSLGFVMACSSSSDSSSTSTNVAASDSGALATGEENGDGSTSTASAGAGAGAGADASAPDGGVGLDASLGESAALDGSTNVQLINVDGSDGANTDDAGAAMESSDAGDDDDASDGSIVPLRGVHSTGLSLSVNGTTRTYDVTLPSTCTAATKVPLIFVFHADEQTSAVIYHAFPIEEAAAVAGQDAVYVYPNGLSTNENGTAWNIYDDPGTYPYSKADPSGNEDVDFFDAMVTAFSATPCADVSHVFVAGFSSGAYFTNQIARWRSTVVKALASQSGGPPAGVSPSDYAVSPYCVEPTSAVPAIIIHGQSDSVVDPTLGEQNVSYWDIANSCSNSANDCSASTLVAPPATTTTAIDPSPCVASDGCTTGKPVVFCFIPGMDHAIWSGAPAAIWSFFSTIDAL